MGLFSLCGVAFTQPYRSINLSNQQLRAAEAANAALQAQLLHAAPSTPVATTPLQRPTGSNGNGGNSGDATAAVRAMASRMDAVMSMVADVAAAQARLLGREGPWLACGEEAEGGEQEQEEEGFESLSSSSPSSSSYSLSCASHPHRHDDEEEASTATWTGVGVTSLAERGLELLTRLLGEAMGTQSEAWPASLQVRWNNNGRNRFFWGGGVRRRPSSVDLVPSKNTNHINTTRERRRPARRWRACWRTWGGWNGILPSTWA